jgi:hypothetical protein
MLREELRGGVVATVDYSSCRTKAGLPYYRVTGRLDIGPLFASVEVRVWQDFMVLKRVPPAVWCNESWMRDGPDWHNSRASGMCWILQEVWRDGMSWKGKSALAILKEGREWLINDVRCLINRHYVASCEGLTEWPNEWPFWSHYNEGAEEYERTERIRRSRELQRR